MDPILPKPVSFWSVDGSTPLTIKLCVGLLCVCFAIILRYHWNRRRLYILAANLPGPRSLPLLGNALEFACKQKDMFKRTNAVIRSYPSPSRLWFGPYLYVLVSEPKDIEIILTHPHAAYKDRLYRFTESFVGKGLVSGSGPMWKLHKKMITPTFHMKILEKYINIFNEQVEILTSKLEAEAATGNQFNILSYTSHCSVDIVCETIMGTKVEAQNNKNVEFVHCTENMYVLIYERMLKVWLHSDYIFKLTKSYQLTNQAKQVIGRFIKQVILSKKAEFEKNLPDNEEAGETRQLTTLEQLFFINKNGEYFTEEELQQEIYTLFTAAQDTTALISAFLMMMLGMHPDVQDRVYQEVCEIVGSDVHQHLDWDTYQRFTYLEMVIKETLRLFPIAPAMPRQLQGDVKLTNHTLPAGCSVVVCTYQVHRREEYWENPESFDPDRFLPEQVAKRHPYAYIPFSGGIRKCIGQKYAMLTLKTIIVHVVRKFKILSDLKYEDLELMSDISIRSRNGYNIRLQRR